MSLILTQMEMNYTVQYYQSPTAPGSDDKLMMPQLAV